MKAFHGDPAVKEKYLARLKAHHEADEIIQGSGWDNGRGCAVGCTLNQYNHLAYKDELGLPQWLARLEDRIFEGLPAGDAPQFAVSFLEAIPVGASVDGVRWQLASQRHTRDRNRIAQNTEDYAKQVVAALDLVIAYCDSEEKTESAAWSAARSAWSAARSAARSARSAGWSAGWSAESAGWSAESAARSARSAESAAWSAAESAWSAESAARSAAWSAESAARSAAWSAESAAGWSAESAARSARSDHFKWEAETLLTLLRNAPQAAE